MTSAKTTPAKQSEVVVVELAGTGRQNQLESMKVDPSEEDDASTVTMSSATPVNMDDLLVRPRRCTRLQKEEVLKPHDSDTCPLGKFPIIRR